MSEEEKKAIEKLKRIIEKYEHKPIGKISVEFDEFDYNLFKTLLNLIDNQQKETSLLKDQLEYVISEYEETIDQQQKEIEELKVAFNNCFDECTSLIEISKNWEDKIKAKIEECREILYSFEKELELKANKDKFIHKESMNCLLGQISILQSLLEKEDLDKLKEDLDKLKKLDLIKIKAKEYISKDKIKAILEEYKYTEIGDNEKIIEFYKKMQSLLEKEY